VIAPEPFDYTLDERSYVRLSQRICIRNGLKGFLVAVAFLFAVQIALDMSAGDDDFTSVLFGALVGLIFAVGLWWYAGRQARAIYREQPSMQETRRVTLTEHEISFEMPSGTFSTAWASIVKWDDIAGVFVLYLNRAMMLPMPHDAVSEANLNYMRAQIIASGLPKPGKRRR